MTQDSQSHRIIEKRRRDRINNSLTDLASLLATSHGGGQLALTKHAAGQGRVKKTEIIETAIRRIHQLQSELLGLYSFIRDDLNGLASETPPLLDSEESLAREVINP